MKKILLLLILSLSVYAGDFRDLKWGMSREEAFTKETLEKIEYKEQKITKTFKTYKGDMEFNYTTDEYSFYDTIGSLGQFKVTLVFLKNRLIRSKYEQKITDEQKEYNLFKKYLIWKYGTDYTVSGFDDNFIWNRERTKVILDIIPHNHYTVEYYANTEEMLDFIYDIENAIEFQNSIGSEYKEYNSIKNKI